MGQLIAAQEIKVQVMHLLKACVMVSLALVLSSCIDGDSDSGTYARESTPATAKCTRTNEMPPLSLMHAPLVLYCGVHAQHEREMRVTIMSRWHAGHPVRVYDCRLLGQGYWLCDIDFIEGHPPDRATIRIDIGSVSHEVEIALSIESVLDVSDRVGLLISSDPRTVSSSSRLPYRIWFEVSVSEGIAADEIIFVWADDLSLFPGKKAVPCIRHGPTNAIGFVDVSMDRQMLGQVRTLKGKIVQKFPSGDEERLEGVTATVLSVVN